MPSIIGWNKLTDNISNLCDAMESTIYIVKSVIYEAGQSKTDKYDVHVYITTQILALWNKAVTIKDYRQDYTYLQNAIATPTELQKVVEVAAMTEQRRCQNMCHIASYSFTHYINCTL